MPEVPGPDGLPNMTELGKQALADIPDKLERFVAVCDRFNGKTGEKDAADSYSQAMLWLTREVPQRYISERGRLRRRRAT